MLSKLKTFVKKFNIGRKAMGENDLQDDINKMIDLEETVDQSTSGTTSPSTESPGGTQAPGTEAPGTEAPGTEAPSTEAPGTAAPTTKAPGEETELERVKRENDELRVELADERKKKPATKAPGTSAPTTDAPLQDIDFVGEEEDWDDISNDPKKVNKLLNKVYQSGVQSAVDRLASTNQTQDIPGQVQKNLDIMLAMREANESFYADNKDLQPFKKVVATVYSELADAHPDWTVKKCLEETGVEARNRLELKPAKTPPGKKQKRKANLPPGTKGGRHSKQKPQNTGLQSEIDAMNADLD
jgi:hypothetical protein